MKNNSIIFIGLDTHKEFTEVAYCGDQPGSDVVHLGRVSSAKASITKMARQFEIKNPKATLHFAYFSCTLSVQRIVISGTIFQHQDYE
jgi:hypothetical protein